ncbi:MAG: hypothetical protein ACYTGF_07630 [Planctomycetota bacterium]|jgi:hypothetical protein
MRTASAQPVVLWMFIPAVILVAAPVAVAPAVGPQCEVVCSDVSIDEPGSCGYENNGGCSNWPSPWIPASSGDVICGRAWAEAGTRDTDFYLLCVEDPDGDGVAQVCGTLISEFPGVCFIVDGISEGQCEPAVCNPIAIGHTGCADSCGNMAVASACVSAPGDYVVFVAPGNCDGSGIFDGYPCGTSNDYQVCITVTDSCDDTCGACPTGAECPADLDGDGSVGVVDFLWLLAQWGTDPGGPPDFDGDGIVGMSDFLVLTGAWGPCP